MRSTSRCPGVLLFIAISRNITNLDLFCEISIDGIILWLHICRISGRLYGFRLRKLSYCIFYCSLFNTRYDLYNSIDSFHFEADLSVPISRITRVVEFVFNAKLFQTVNGSVNQIAGS